MKTEKAVVLTVLICVGFILSYWLGFENGRRSKPQLLQAGPEVALAKPESAPVPKPPIEPEPPSQLVDRLAHIAKGPTNIPPRDPAAKPQLIDLSPWYNAGLTATWHGQDPGNDLSSLPSGLQTFDGTPFDVRGLIQLRASFLGSELFSKRVNGIRIGKRCEKLHFLHNAASGPVPPRGLLIGTYLMHYADGDTLKIPLRVGENIQDWWMWAKETPTTAVVVWEGTNDASAKQKQRIHVSKFTWENPRPETEVASLDLVGESGTCAPFLIAITAEP
jgi:hypothetical protein